MQTIRSRLSVHLRKLAYFTKMMDQPCDDDDDFEFPTVLNFGSLDQETIFKSPTTISISDRETTEESAVLESENTGDWLKLRCYSPVLDALARWNDNTTIEDKEVCLLLNMDTSNASLQLVKSYLSGNELVGIGVDELKEVLRVSDMLFLNDLVNYCKYRIQNTKISEKNFLEILEITSLYDFVHKDIEYFFMSHLPLLTTTEGSERLTFETVLFLLTYEVLAYWTMEQRFNFVTKWCKAKFSRIELFSGLFELIDLSCLEQDFIKSVVQTEYLVRGSNQCLRRVDYALQRCMTSKPVPSVIIGDTPLDTLTAFMLDNRRTGDVMSLNSDAKSDILGGPIVAWNVLLPDCIVVITSDTHVMTNTLSIIKYNMNTQQTVSKKLDGVLNNHFVRWNSKAQLLCQNDTSFLVDHGFALKTEKKFNNRGRQVVSSKRFPTSTIYIIKDKDTAKTVLFLPMMSFKSEVTQICVMKSCLLVRCRSDACIYCFNWTSYTHTKITLPQDMHSASPSSLLTLLPSEEALYAVFQSYIIQCTFDESTAEMTSVRKFYVDVGSDPFVTIATTEDVLIRVDNEYIHVCESIQHSLLWKSYKLSDRRLSPLKSIVNYCFLRKNIALCHHDCPHCQRGYEFQTDEYTDFGSLYTKKVAAKNERERAQQQVFDDDYYLDKYDFYDDYEDDYNSYDEGPRMIYLASDDEWVEEWW